jgi:hypothetical protein
MTEVTQSSTLDPDSGKLDCSELVEVPATAAAISKGVEWIQHEWHRKESPLAKNVQAAFISDFVTGLAKDCVLYVAVLKMADFFALDGLVSALLSIVSDDALQQAVLDSFPPLASLVAPLGGLAEEEMEERLSRVTTLTDRVSLLGAMVTKAGASKLRWAQLQKCDGLYLKRAGPGLSAQEKRELDAIPDLERRKELEDKRDALQPDTNACLELFAWARAERERRQALTDAMVAANKAARASLTAEETMHLDNELGNALANLDLAAAEAAFAKGAEPSLCMTDEMYENGMMVFSREDELRENEIAWVSQDQLPSTPVIKIEYGFGFEDKKDAFLPLICQVADTVSCANWLLDHGVSIKTSQADTICFDDGNGFGGANALWHTDRLAAVEELCARGADVNCCFTHPSYEETRAELGLLTRHANNDQIARCLVRHGADVNAMLGDTYSEDGNEFGCYWKTVVE